MKRYQDLVVVLVLVSAGCSSSKYHDCPESCKKPLGLESGIIRKDQLTAFTAYQNDFTNFGAHRARLNLKDWPPGYRASPVESTKLPWIRVDLGKDLVITGIATQGYGNASVAEWVTSYQLMFAKGVEFRNFVDINGDVLNFLGNQDSDTIRRNEIRVPVVASSVILVPTTWHNNIGLRMELYGCKPEYYFVAWLMLDQTPFSLNHFNKTTVEYKSSALQATEEVHSYLNSVAGYLFSKLLRFSPQTSPGISTFATAEIAIYCTEESVHHLIAKLKALVSTESTAFAPNYLKIQYPLACDCRPPTIDLELKNYLSEAEVVNTSDTSYYLRTRVTSNCSTSTESHFRWMISKIDRETGYFFPFLRYGPPNRNVIKLYPRLMKTGYLYVSVEAWVPDIQGTFVYDFGFLKIRRPALVAKVVGPTVVARGIGNITLDASQSYDPTNKRSPYSGLQFAWSCHRKCLRHQINSSLLSESEVEGCGFGPSSQIGEIFSTQRSISVNADQMESNCTYTFQLSVSKVERMSRMTHVLQVKPAVLFYIRCITNCNMKISSTRLLSLQLFCVYPPCFSKATLTWTIHVQSIEDDVTEWIELKNISGKVQVSPTELQIPRLNALITVQEGMMIRIDVKAFIREDLEEQVFYTFPVNAPPVKEPEEVGCKVEPKEGSAILTDFHISCLGWYDKDTPLRYAFKYTFSHSTIIVQHGTVGNVTTKLPLGDPSKDYERLLQLQIIDALGEFSTVLVTIKVRPPLVSETLLGLLREARDEMKLLVEANDVDKAADMALTVLSVVDENEKLEHNETFKDSVLDIMTGVKIDRLNLVTKVAVIVAYSTKRRNQSFSQDSQEGSLRLLQKMTFFMKTLHTNKTKELNVANDINVNLLTGIGNVITSSARDSSSEATQIDAHIDKEKSKNITKSSLALLKVFKDELVTGEGVCSQPTVITTIYINVSACVERVLDIKAHKLLNGESAVMLPNARYLFPGQPLDEDTLIDIKLVSYKENPYTWHNSSRILKSSVFDIELRNLTSGKPLRISGLTKPIEMVIKNERRGLEKALQNITPQREFYIKPSSPHSIENMRYHRISMPYKDVEATIRIEPSNNVKLEVYIRYGVRPTPAQSNFQTVVPNTTTCLNNTKRDGFNNCLSDAYAFAVSTGKIGLHFLGIRYVVDPPERVNKRRRRRTKRSCLDIGGRQKRSCVEVKSPPSIEAATSDFKNGSDVKYTLSVTMGACMYWSEESEEWTSQGCKVGSQATPGKLQCMCTHLSSFGGDLFVAPNPIDFDKVWVQFGQLGETGNFVVLTFICVVFGLYFIGLVLARTVDRRDICEVAPNVHIMTEADCKHVYEISIQTGIWRGCGTTASVVIILFGENGCTPPITLSQKHLQQRFFARGSVNTFTIHLTESLGSLFKIKIWHDNAGTSPAWFFHQVLITEPETQEKWYFLGNRWLALEKGNGKISAEIMAAGNKEYLAFRNLFHFRGAKTLGEKHLWLSLFTKAPHSTFTRCQRLSCCLSILMATMVTNAMFYKQGLELKSTFKVGPIELSWTQIKIGLQSGLVAIPVNVLVVAIFRNIKPAVLSRSEGNLLQSDDDSNRTGCCPYFCGYIGWMLCIMTSLVSAAFVVFYSLMWGKDTANQWLASVMISFFQDVIVIEPVKVVLLVSLLSLIIKKPIENDEIHGQGQSNQTFDKKITSYPPKDEELHQVRITRMMRTRMLKCLIEITVFVLFIFLLMIVCYGNRKSTRYELTDAVRKLFARFDKVNRTDSFWRWTKETLLPGLFEVKWYNGRPFSYKEGFIANHEAFILGMPRLRQQRIKPDTTCEIIDHEPQLAKKFSRCIPRFSTGSEDKTKYHMPGWIPIHNSTVFKSHFEKLFLCPRPWRYETAKELQTLSFQGLLSMYSGGGFVADLGYNTDDALPVIYSLEKNGWIDNATAVVFVEFTIYEPTSSLFSSVKFVFERFANGDTNTITRIKTLTIYSPQDPSFRGFYETCQLLFMLLVLFCVASELGNVYQRGCVFFKDPWSWMEILLLSSSMLSVAIFFLKEAYTSDFIAKVKKNPFQSWSIDEIELWSDLEVTLLSFVVFLVTMKLLRIIRFNPQIIQMRLTLHIVGRHFLSFMMVFFTVVIAYVQFTTLTFGSSVYEYRSFVRSFSSILLMLIGAKAPFHKLRAVSIILGPFFIFAYMISIVMILLNMFLAILNDSYTESRRVGIEGLEDLELSRLLKQKAKQVANQVRVLVIKIIQAFPRLLRQGLPRNAMTFNAEVGMAFVCAESKEENPESIEDLAFTDDGESSLNDVISLLADIKEDLRPSIMSLDDIVPIVTIDDTDKRWDESTESLEGWKRYSCSSLFSNKSGSAISKTDYPTNHRKDQKAVVGDFLVAESWNLKKPLQGEEFI